MERLTAKAAIITSVLILITVSFTACFSDNDEAVKDKQKELTEYLDDSVPELLDYYDIPGASVALIQDGGLSWSGQYGYADLEENRAATEDTLFRAESISKSITAWGIMKLVEQGDISLDDPVDNYLDNWNFPETEFNEEKVTIRNLLSHSSGITGNSDRRLPGREVPSREEVLAGEHGLHEAKLVRKPDSSFEYSNQGFILLEMIVEKVTGREYQEYFQEEILQPLKMYDSKYNFHSEEVQSNLITSYYLNGDRVPKHVYPFKGGPGGLYTTAEDLAQFYAAGMSSSRNKGSGEEKLTTESVDKLYTSFVEPANFYALGADGVGLGHFIDELETGEKAVYHGGEGAGSLSKAYSVPEEGEGIIIMTNSKRSWPFLFTLLGEWADWTGIGQPAMSSLYEKVYTGIWIIIVFLSLLSLYTITSLIRGLVAGHLIFSPLACSTRIYRLIKCGFAIILFGVWWWVNESFINNLLPVLQGRLSLTVAVFAVLMIISALFVKNPDQPKISK